MDILRLVVINIDISDYHRLRLSVRSELKFKLTSKFKYYQRGVDKILDCQRSIVTKNINTRDACQKWEDDPKERVFAGLTLVAAQFDPGWFKYLNRDRNYKQFHIFINGLENELFRFIILHPDVCSPRIMQDAFCAAVYLNLDRIVNILLELGVDPSHTANLSIRLAAKQGHIDVINTLLNDKRVDPSSLQNCAIQTAGRCGHFEATARLIKDPRVDIAANNNYVIQIASEHGNFDIVELLLKEEVVDPSANDNYALKLSAENGHTKIVSLLLKDDRVDSRAHGEYAIRYARTNGHADIVKLLKKDSLRYKISRKLNKCK